MTRRAIDHPPGTDEKVFKTKVRLWWHDGPLA